MDTKKKIIKNKKTGKPRKNEKKQGKKVIKKVRNKKVRTKVPVGKGDVRLAKPSVQTETAANLKSNVSHTMRLGESVQYIMGSWVSLALSKGYMTSVSDVNFPYFAYVYGVQTLLNAANGTIVQTQQLPRWMLMLCQTLTPKGVSMGQGMVTVKWIADPTVVPQPKLLASGPYGYEKVFYVPTTGDVDQFPASTAPAAYTDDLGAKAFGDLVLYLATNSPKDDTAFFNQAVPYSTHTPWEQNISASCFQSLPEGIGASGFGGWSYLACHEVPIWCPLLSGIGAVGNVGTGVEQLRFPRFVTSFGGDSNQIPIFMSALCTSSRHMEFKRAPKYHFVDFLEFGDVLANWVLMAQNLGALQSAGNTDPLALQCPISLQEMLLLLRNEIMSTFCPSQIAGEFLNPKVPNVNTQNGFVPYLCSSTTVPVTVVGMVLPLPFVENIKALVQRAVPHKGKDRDLEWFMTVLGQFALDRLVATDYKYVFGGTTYNSFITLPEVIKVKRRNSKGEIQLMPYVEQPIDLVDGSVGSTYYFINNPTRLQGLATLWNTWTTKISAYSSNLTTLSKDLGSPAVVSCGMTLHQTMTESARQREIENDTVDVRRVHFSVSQVYRGRQAYVITSNGPLLAGPTEEILTNWILPINTLDNSFNDQSLTGYVRVQDMMNEPFSYFLSSVGDIAVDMASRHASYASRMVKGIASAPSNWDLFFTEENKKGHAGILSSLAANLIGAAFGKTAGDVANGVANILPV